MSKISTSTEIVEEVTNRLKEFGDNVQNVKLVDGRGFGEFIPKGSVSPVDFEFKVGYIREQSAVGSNWDSSYTVKDDGEVFDGDGNSIGWIKILQNEPTKCERLYDKDDITLTIPKTGNRKYKLNNANAKNIVKDLAFAARVSQKEKTIQ